MILEMETTLVQKILGYLPGTIIPAVLTLLSLKIFSTYLSIDEFGLYNYWLTLSMLISSVFSQWISQPTLRYSTDKKMIYQDEVVSFFVLIIGVMLSMILILENLIFDGENILLYSSVTVLIFLFTCIQIIYTKLQVNFQIKKYSILRLIESVAKVMLPIIGIFLFIPSTNIIFLSMIVGIVLMLFKNYKILFPKFIFSKKLMNDKEFINTQKAYFSFGLPMVVWFSINGVMSFTDRFLLKKFSGYDAVAIYSANYSLITGSVALVTTPLLMIAHPMLMNRWNNSEKVEAGKILSYFIEIFMTFSFLLAALTFMNRDIITLVFLDEKFKDGNVVMPLILVGFIIWQLGMLFHKPIEFKENTKKMVIAMLIACGTNIVLNILLIPRISYIGAAISSIIGYTVYSVIVFKWGNEVVQYQFMDMRRLFKNVILLTIILLVMYTLSNLNLSISMMILNIILSIIYMTIYTKINYKRLIGLLKVIK